MSHSRSPQPALIHIGLPKTASTCLQTAWHTMPEVCLVKDGLLTLIHDCEKRGRSGTPSTIKLAPVPIDFDVPHQPGQQVVYSNEALSTFYVNERADKATIRAYQELVAGRLKTVVPKSKILIVTRSPDAWIRSMYNQTVKQGSADAFRRFLVHERDFIEQTLSIRELFTIWKQHYGSDNILILPVEMLWEDEDRFFGEIERFTGIKAPNRAHRPATASNVSLSEDNLELMRQFNKWAKVFTEHGRHNGQLPEHLDLALRSIRFDVRYNLEAPTPGLERRLRVLKRGITEQGIADIEISHRLLKALRGNFAKHFRKDDFFGYKKLYT